MDTCPVCKAELADEAAKAAHMKEMKDDPAHMNMGGGDMGGSTPPAGGTGGDAMADDGKAT